MHFIPTQSATSQHFINNCLFFISILFLFSKTCSSFHQQTLFSRFLFFYQSKLEETQITLKILYKSVARTIIETECFFGLSRFFSEFFPCLKIAPSKKFCYVWRKTFAPLLQKKSPKDFAPKKKPRKIRKKNLVAKEKFEIFEFCS